MQNNLSGQREVKYNQLNIISKVVTEPSEFIKVITGQVIPTLKKFICFNLYFNPPSKLTVAGKAELHFF